MSNEIVDVAELDCVYLTYDEPQREEFWVKIKNMIPWAKRVDGVKGSDAAHKAAASISDTERFIIVDGDNLPDIKFFDKQLILNDENKNAQFRWRSKNVINNLYYGNGGISCWTKSFVNAMKTHEHSEGDSKTNIEFCFNSNYWPMHDCYSTTHINITPKQAWRAGFREGVKLCTREGKEAPSVRDFSNWIWPNNKKNLLIWQTIGRDIENGFWAILGARTGTMYLMLKEWNHVDVRDFDKLDKLWDTHCNDDELVCQQVGKDLRKYLDLDVVEFFEEQSAFIKNNIFNDWKNVDIMVRERF